VKWFGGMRNKAAGQLELFEKIREDQSSVILRMLISNPVILER